MDEFVTLWACPAGDASFVIQQGALDDGWGEHAAARAVDAERKHRARHPDHFLLCRCHIACSERATQEDGYCDVCRTARQTNHGVGHGHIGEPGAPPGSPMRPIAGTFPMPFNVEVTL